MTQISRVLPRANWLDITIKENNNPLVLLKETKQLKIGGVHKMYEPSFLVRSMVADKLYRIAELLPPRLCLVVIEAYRSMEHQQASWDRLVAQLRREHTEWDDIQIEKEARLTIAFPHPLANHHCGGAVDVTLAQKDGPLLDMGSPYPSEAFPKKIREKFPMFPNSFLKRVITQEHEDNRKILRDAMTAKGFVWYPGEWWHYCYGDRMWAVYSRRKKCFFGPIEP